jgi:hypothetical protein
VWSAEQVIALAPDSSSVAAARKLRNWPDAGADERAVWGLAQGSGKAPYEVVVDLDGPAYNCSCPSRKFPCKHALGLLLRWAEGQVAAGDRPAFAGEWLAGREERAARPAREGPPDAEAQARRAEAREEKITAGMEELDRWLRDLVRGGLAGAKAQPYSFWQAMAARLVDAQAPGAASRVRALSGLAHAGDAWPGRLLEGAASLHLLARAWARRAELDAQLRASVRAAVGWPVAAEEVRARPAVRDRWAVIAQAAGEDERLAWRRTWLRGETQGREALILQFSATGAFDGDYVPGSVVEGGLCFYPGAVELRALPEDELRRVGDVDEPQGTDVGGWLRAWAALLARDPWLDRHVAVLAPASFVGHEGEWWVRGADGGGLRIAGDPPFDLVAEAGGREVSIAGEWRGGRFTPLAAYA